jgi:polyisoprenoid-binding protein YceI
MIAKFKMTIRGLIYSLIFLSVAGCMQEPKSDNAVINEALPVEEKNAGIICRLDTGNSLVTWVGTKPTGRHTGLIRIRSGSITIQEEDTERKIKKFNVNNAKIVIDMGSVKVLDLMDNPLQLEKLEKHLKSEDFFDTETYETAEFELISFEPIENDSLVRAKNKYSIIDPTHTMSGNLTIKGKTLNIEVPVKADYRNLKFEASAKFNIDRTMWNITYQDENDPVARATDGFIHNIVNVGFEIIARPESIME